MVSGYTQVSPTMLSYHVTPDDTPPSESLCSSEPIRQKNDILATCAGNVSLSWSAVMLRRLFERNRACGLFVSLLEHAGSCDHFCFQLW